MPLAELWSCYFFYTGKTSFLFALVEAMQSLVITHPLQASAGRFKLEECEQTINGSKVVVLEASGLSKAKDVEELRKSLSKKRKTVDLVLLVEALQQAGSVDVAREMGAKFGAQLLNAAVPVFACGHVQVRRSVYCVSL